MSILAVTFLFLSNFENQYLKAKGKKETYSPLCKVVLPQHAVGILRPTLS